ncbi:carboxymuconolactone decarboxylase family protein [Streptomyces sp. NBC_01462]|uniref:carboxymuconolactone decarboxylase family protein n=1 Tax=Streptomyces sp. NBC_01462 TaxID=2903876 RepID=UPI002E30ABC2|nr:carboxymuconolactone decarboxylase family protein [Streptomyces sp. NBC_01462]
MPSPFRHTTPPEPASASGPVRAVYTQLARDFGITRAPTFVVLSSVPEIMASAWALMRESLIAGDGGRTGKELAALGVSEANRCPFCVDAHKMLLHATGDHALAERVARGEQPADEDQARVLAWGRATRIPGAPELTPYPFPAPHAPAYIGTALAFHFINRVVSALLTERLLPGNVQRFRAVRSLGGRSLSRTVRRHPAPGAGLTLLDGAGLALLDHAGPGPDWARATTVGPAYAALRAAAGEGERLLDADDRILVRETLGAWDGAHPPLAWDGLPGRDRPGARLALLAALAPYRITEEDVAAWRTPDRTDAALVRLVAYGAFAAVDRIESALPVRTAKEAS